MQGNRKKHGCLIAVLVIIGISIVISLFSRCTARFFSRSTGETSVTETEQATAPPQTTTISTATTTKAVTATTTSAVTTTTPAETTTEALKGGDAAAAVQNGDYSLVTPEFKKQMDAYEAFYDEYIAFMKKYTSGTGDALAMLNDYMSMMQKLNEWGAWVDEIDEAELTPADDAYYLLVTLRVSEKMLKAAL